MNDISRTPDALDDAAKRERIGRLAHEIWEAEGRPEGQSVRHWSMAERLVEAEERARAHAAFERADGSSA